MKQRIISAAVGLMILFVVLFFYQTVVLNIAVALVGIIGVYELLAASGYPKTHKWLTGLALLYAAIVPFFPWFPGLWRLTSLLFVFALFGLYLGGHKTIRLEEVAVTFLAGVIVPFAMTSLVLIRDQFMGQSQWIALFYILLALGAAWLADSGAYFTGRLFGKHKLSPEVSPHKTVEGAVGGVVANAACFALLGFGFQKMMEAMGTAVTVHYVSLALVGALCALVGMLGDLSASVVKRQHGVKDFGNIMPGHGGVLDRFDSVLFVTPFFYLVLQFIPFVSL